MKTPATKSWVGDSDPEFDAKAAEGFVGKYVLLGITHLSPSEEVTLQEQLHGRIERACDVGIDIALCGVYEGQVWRMPPMFNEFEAAEPGVYELRSTGEGVENPDLILFLTVKAAANSCVI